MGGGCDAARGPLGSQSGLLGPEFFELRETENKEVVVRSGDRTAPYRVKFLYPDQWPRHPIHIAQTRSSIAQTTRFQAIQNKLVRLNFYSCFFCVPFYALPPGFAIYSHSFSLDFFTIYDTQTSCTKNIVTLIANHHPW